MILIKYFLTLASIVCLLWGTSRSPSDFSDTLSGAGDIVTVTRMTPSDRENLYSNTNFLPSMLNNDFGILTLVDQQAQLVDQRIGPRYNYSAVIVPVIDSILPILGPNQVWVKNQTNDAIEAMDFSGGGGGGSGTVTEVNTGLGLTGTTLRYLAPFHLHRSMRILFGGTLRDRLLCRRWCLHPTF